MAAPAATHGDEHAKLEDEFQQAIRRMGGKERIYLVGEVFKTEDNQCNSFKTFIDEMFRSCRKNGPIASCVSKTLSDNTNQNTEDQTDTLNDVADIRDIVLSTQDPSAPTMGGTEPRCKGEVPRVIRTSRNGSGFVRLIDAALVIFIFKHEYISNSCNHVLMKEIMKDIRARTKHSSPSFAVIGLVHSKDESRERLKSVEVLERVLRSVFRKHSSESIWTGLFVPDTPENMWAIKKHASKAVHSSLSSDNARRANSRPWSLRCLFWWRQRRRPRDQHSSITCAMETVEGIPLKSRLDVRGHQGDFANGFCSSGN